MVQVLVKDRKYAGKYVAINDFDSSKVVAAGETPYEAYTRAIFKKCMNPVIMFIPLKDLVQIY